MAEKERLDVALQSRGLAPSRTHAQALIMAGQVLVNGQQAQKASQIVRATDAVTIKEKLRYVSRGGLKLEKALCVFPIRVSGKRCLDVGASTGGFTDCLLQNGAQKVYAVDVGHGQLDYALRNDTRVVCMERCNARNLTVEQIKAPVEFACADVSFISLKLILPPMRDCLLSEGEMVVLIKPQFEAGREQIGKGGVVRDVRVRRQICIEMLHYAHSIGLYPYGLDVSPITGPKGNVEFLLWLKKQPGGITETRFETLCEQIALQTP